jgi:hypothetical protein
VTRAETADAAAQLQLPDPVTFDRRTLEGRSGYRFLSPLGVFFALAQSYVYSFAPDTVRRSMTVHHVSAEQPSRITCFKRHASFKGRFTG